MPAGLDAADFGTTERADGSSQTTYRGWPLYRFASDTAAGDRTGEAVGGVWFLIPNPFYTLLHRADETNGRYLADAEGRTLYYFARDVPAGESAEAVSGCAGDCLAAWPIVEAAETVVLPSDLNPEAFGALTRDDGSVQQLYRGWPMYAFASDDAPGDVTGDGAGGVWFVHATPFFNTLVMNDGARTYLAAQDGFALYLFRNDTRGDGATPPVSACSGGCLGAWPPYRVPEVNAPSILEDADFSVLTRDDGTEQLVYRGWPLYRYGGDSAPGDTTGDGAGGVWELIGPPE